MQKRTLPIRKNVPVEETWDLDSIFQDIEAWEKAKQDVLSMIKPLTDFKGKLANDSRTLADFLELYEKALRKAMLVYVYGSLESSVDTTNQDAQARAGQGQTVLVKLRAATSFHEPELMQIGFDVLHSWMRTDKRLGHLTHYIDDLERMQQHIRSDEVEELLAAAGEPLNDFFRAYNALVNADLQFEDAITSDGSAFEVGQSSIASLISHIERKVRETAFENYAKGYLQHKNTIASIQIGGIHRDVFYARASHFPSSLEASLSRNNIPTDVFHALIDAFKQNLPIWHQYWRIRKKALGVDTLCVHDIKAPLTTKSPEIPFGQAIKWIGEGLSPLGDRYVRILKKGALEERWIDRACNRGKRQGAFSSGVYDTHPFVMMSYADDIFSLSTLAHELGHSMHSYYSKREQPFIYSRYSLFAAEVASNFNQAMVRDYLFRTQSEPAFQIALIEEAMSNFHRYFFIMPTLARWELEVHERAEAGKALNADIMTDICADYFAEGYGDEIQFEKDKTGITWAQFQHMYMNFYVFQYATGISAAHALVKGIQEGGQSEVERYLTFLSSGGSDYPIDALKAAGVDMTSPEPVNKAFLVMAEFVNKLEDLVG